MEIKDIIRQWINWKSTISNSEYTQDMLARAAGIYPSNLSDILTGKTDPRKSTIDKIIKGLGLSTSEFYAGPPAAKPLAPPAPSAPRSPSISELTVLGEVDLIETVPLLTSIPAGPWKSWVDSYPPGYGEGRVPRYGVRGDHVFALRVDGDSMVPYLLPGDVLYINPERAFTNFHGGIGVVKFDGDYKIRQVWRRGDNYLLEPANKSYEPEMVPVTGTTIFKIVKRVTENEGMF